MRAGVRELVVLGGGVVGLSAARELARRGLRTTVVERAAVAAEPPAGAATWASLGVLSALAGGRSPFRRLQAWGHRAYPELARELLAETGIDIGYQVRGSLHLKAAMPRASSRLKAERLFRDAGLQARWLDAAELRGLAPGLLDGESMCHGAAFFIAGEAIVDPPGLARALRASCERLGVQILEQAGDASLVPGPVPGVELGHGERIGCDVLIVATGAWSRLVSLRDGFAGVPVRPVRGQALEITSSLECLNRLPNLRFEDPELRREYHIVPRGGCLAWIGSTVEDVGFDAGVTAAGIDELLTAARRVIPDLSRRDVVRSWAGLRPQALRPGGPFLGRLPGGGDVWAACGHYRSGILTGPVSARLLVQEILGEKLDEESGLDAAAVQSFRVER